MSYTLSHNIDEHQQKSKLKSGIITAITGILILLLALFYTWTEKRISRQVTILVNFTEEPKVQEIVPKIVPITKNNNLDVSNSKGSKAQSSNKNTSATSNKFSSTKPKADVISNDISDNKTVVSAKKNNAQTQGPTDEEKRRRNQANDVLNQFKKNKTRGGDGTSSTGKGTGTTDGDGDGTGGDGRFGSGGRKLIGFIPGTEGKGGEIPSHNCNASGTITFKYTVDKSGKVIDADRISGLSNPCAIQKGKDWIFQYVRANAGTKSESSTYRISF